MQQQQTDGRRAEQQHIESKISEDLKSEDAKFSWKGQRYNKSPWKQMSNGHWTRISFL
jgi:hypothetical protein